jgi:sugar phosphate isomerase/epimerase
MMPALSMKLGFVSAIFPDLSLAEVLAFAREACFAAVELMCCPAGKAERKYAGVTHVDVANFTKGCADDVNALCAQQRISISALGYYPNPLDPDLVVATHAITHLKKVIRAAALLGMKNVNPFAGRDWTP